jgi:hypothetical protein
VRDLDGLRFKKKREDWKRLREGTETSKLFFPFPSFSMRADVMEKREAHFLRCVVLAHNQENYQ